MGIRYLYIWYICNGIMDKTQKKCKEKQNFIILFNAITFLCHICYFSIIMDIDSCGQKWLLGTRFWEIDIVN